MLRQAVTFGRYRLDPRGGLRLGSREIRLTPKALSLLCFLADHAGQVMTKDELFAGVWPETTVGDAALVTCIQELRKALGDNARRPRYIETLHRRGYRFIEKPGTVTEARAQPTKSPATPAIVVGRDDELRTLHACLGRAATGERQVVFVTGEPGIGKTSLVRAFVSPGALSADVHVTWGQSADHHGATEPYLPLMDALTRSCRGPTGDQFIAALDRHAPSWLAQMPSLLGPEQHRVLRRRTAGVTRERMLRELTDALEAVSHHATVVLWLEDLHWADHSTIDWLAWFARRPEHACVLLIGTYRPVESLITGHPLQGMHDELRRRHNCLEIALPPLTEAAVTDYCQVRFTPAEDDTGPMSRLARRVHQHTEGTPLFMVGIVDDLVSQGLLVKGNGTWIVRDADIGSTPLGIPDNLQRLIGRQIGRLHPTALQLLEAACVVGGTFSAAAAAAGACIAAEDAETLCRDIAQRHQLIDAAGTEAWPDGTVASRFTFRHALYRQTLYGRLPAGQCAALHGRIGDRLEQAYAGRTDEIAGELAMHFERARDTSRAVTYLRKAGRFAGNRGAAREAVTHFRHALDLIATLPKDPSRDTLEAGLHLALCVPLRAVHGYGSAEVEACALAAKALSDHLADGSSKFAASRMVWNVCLMRHPVPQTLEHARALMDIAVATGDPVRLALAHRALGTSLKLAGHLREAAETLTRGAAMADGVPDDLFADFGEHPGMICRAFAAWVQALMGRLDEATRLADAAIEHARERRNAHSLAFALVSSGLAYLFQRDTRRADESASEALALAHEHELPQWLAFGLEIKGWATFQRGDRAAGIGLQEEGLRTLRTTGARTHTSRMLANLAESYLAVGQADKARLHLEAMRDHIDVHGERYYAAERPRLWAQLLALEGAAPAQVDAHMEAALDVARQADAALHVLRAGTDLARAWHARGNPTTARQLLTALCARVTGNVDGPDMADARAVLAELSASSVW